MAAWDRIGKGRYLFMEKRQIAKGIAALAAGAAGAGVAVAAAKGVKNQNVKKKEAAARIEQAQSEYRNTERGKYEKNSKGIYYTNGNYEAFARPRSMRIWWGAVSHLSRRHVFWCATDKCREKISTS